MAFPLQPHPAGLGCPGCYAVFPVVDGTPIVLRDVDAWLREEAISVVARADLPASVWERLIAGAGGPLRRNARRVATYSDPGGSLPGWLRAAVAQAPGPVLDLGCGALDPGRGDVLGVDLDWASLQRYPSQRLLADALDPPFNADSFGTILLVNLLDSCRDPGLLIQQADALLRPGGRVLLASPFAYDDAITPPDRQLSPGAVQGFFEQRGYALTLGEEDWILRPNPRTTVRHACLTLTGTKPAA